VVAEDTGICRLQSTEDVSSQIDQGGDSFCDSADRELDNVLHNHASGLAVRAEGALSATWLAHSRCFANGLGLIPPAETLVRVLSEACDVYCRGDSDLYVCNASPFCKRSASTHQTTRSPGKPRKLARP
jgi:hypothetical protein